MILSFDAGNFVAIAKAGGIPPLVRALARLKIDAVIKVAIPQAVGGSSAHRVCGICGGYFFSVSHVT